MKQPLDYDDHQKSRKLLFWALVAFLTAVLLWSSFELSARFLEAATAPEVPL